MSLVSRFFTGTYKVKRNGPGQYVKGRYVPGKLEELEIEGSLQPTNARELKLPEEGNRLKQFFKFYSDDPILVGSMATLAKPDRVFIDGDEFRAMSLLTWKGTNLDYHVTVLWREPEQVSDGRGAAS
jgi:hypothetical protein